MATKKKAASTALEPIDIYGNWTVKTLKYPRGKRVGLTERKSKFKIRNNGSGHVLEKKELVDWNGDDTEIPLVAVTPADTGNYGATMTLKTEEPVTFEGRSYWFSFGSDDRGESMTFIGEEILAAGVQNTHQGTWGTSGRG